MVVRDKNVKRSGKAFSFGGGFLFFFFIISPVETRSLSLRVRYSSSIGAIVTVLLSTLASKRYCGSAGGPRSLDRARAVVCFTPVMWSRLTRARVIADRNHRGTTRGRRNYSRIPDGISGRLARPFFFYRSSPCRFRFPLPAPPDESN